jgi:hemoglobin
MYARAWLTLATVIGWLCLVGPHAGAAAPGPEDSGEDKHAAPLSREALDKQVYEGLGDAHADGAELYNTGHPSACAYLFQGALTTALPLLEHRPDLQKAIRRGLADALRETSMGHRAWMLHEVIHDVRNELRPVMAATGVGATVWERLGGEKNIKKIVSDWIDSAVADARVNLSRNGRFTLGEKQINDLKNHLVGLASAVGDGPSKYKYTGRTMKEAHKGMGVTDAEFDALVADLKLALLKNGVKPKERDFILEGVQSTRRDIVEGTRTEAPAATGLWERMGGEKKVAKIVDDWIDTAIDDPRVNFTRSGKFKLSREQLADFKHKLVILASAVGGGPFKYDGKSMKEAHRGMGITASEFDALVADLKLALLKNDIQPEDIAVLLKAVSGTRKDVVEVKSGEMPARAGPR